MLIERAVFVRVDVVGFQLHGGLLGPGKDRAPVFAVEDEERPRGHRARVARRLRVVPLLAALPPIVFGGGPAALRISCQPMSLLAGALIVAASWCSSSAAISSSRR